MARLSATNYTTQPFTYATAAADLFKKEDVQVLAQAVDTHDHTTGKGLALPTTAIPPITSAMIVDGTIDTVDLKDSSVTSLKIADGTIATADLAANAVTQRGGAVGSTVSPTTTSGSFVDLPEMSVTLTTTATDVFCWLTVQLENSATGNGVVLAFNLDGADSTSYTVRFSSASLPLVFTLAHRYTLSAGAHTIKGRWAVAVGGTATAGGTARELIVVELKK